MAYWGYFDFVCDFMLPRENPNVLEIGVDKGQTFVPLLSWLSKHKEEGFTLLGVDIMTRTHLMVQLEQMVKDLNEKQKCEVMLESSLTALPKLEKYREDNDYKDGLFDVIFIDGDHNYYTVKKELGYVPALLRTNGIIIFDDYSDKWGLEDEYFADFADYKDNEFATQREGTEHPEKKGVKPAVDEFLEDNPEWLMTDMIVPGKEPRLIYRRDAIELVHVETNTVVDPEQQKEEEEEENV